MDEKKRRIDELTGILNDASARYYGGRDEAMSDYEWDHLFDELQKLESETGYVREDSPTQTTGSEEAITSGNKEAHEFPALSLSKTKSVQELAQWAGSRPVWLSWKLDGITLVATYDGGALKKLMTRGNGQVGTNITYLAPFIRGIPARIKDKGHLVVRGEALISYPDFQRINDLGEEEEGYANPRNLVAGTLNLDAVRAEEVSERGVHYTPFTLVYCDSPILSWGERMDYLENLGFSPVEHEKTDAKGLPQVIEHWTQKVKTGSFKDPVDGLVVTYDDTAYAATGSVTGHHAVNAGKAFKWQDVSAETTLDHIEWSCAAQSIAPVAVFDMVMLEGTQVRRASLCNISECLRLGIGADRKTTLTVIKSNMIIPKCIAADPHGTSFTIPKVCPVCQAPTEIHLSEKTGTQTLRCTNPDCTAKQIQKFTRFVSKPGMDIDGLSLHTITKFINEGFLKDFADIYRLSDYEEKIKAMEGFGEKSYVNLMRSVEKSRIVSPVRFLFALCIPMIGADAGKKIFTSLGTEGFFAALEEGKPFDNIDGIGPEKSGSILSWYQEEKNKKLLAKLLGEVTVEKVEPSIAVGSCKGLTFVVTGDVHLFANRSSFIAYVESQGGKVTGSVSKKTDFLVNNDSESSSAKNRKARELGIPILTEEDFAARFGS